MTTTPTTINQPTAAPTRKVTAAIVAGVVVTLGTALASALTDLGAAATIVSAITTTVNVAAAYLRAERA